MAIAQQYNTTSMAIAQQYNTTSMAIAQQYNPTAMVAFVEQIQQDIASHLANVQQYNTCGNRSLH